MFEAKVLCPHGRYCDARGCVFDLRIEEHRQFPSKGALQNKIVHLSKDFHLCLNATFHRDVVSRVTPGTLRNLFIPCGQTIAPLHKYRIELQKTLKTSAIVCLHECARSSWTGFCPKTTAEQILDTANHAFMHQHAIASQPQRIATTSTKTTVLSPHTM